ncbi:BNR-4 repeat-containing protein [Patescibacteria group bacterium]
MHRKKTIISFIIFALAFVLSGMELFPVFVQAEAGEEPIVINANGAWSWFQDPRAIFTECELIVGSTANYGTSPSAEYQGSSDIATYNLETGERRVDTVSGYTYSDDHSAPAVIEMDAGKLLAFYTLHSRNRSAYSLVRFPETQRWSRSNEFIDDGLVTYSNVHELADENDGNGKIYNFFRGEGLEPNIISSSDQGASWQDRGKLIEDETIRPYVKYADDGKSKIHFITTESHPRDYVEPEGNSVYHGYIENDKIYNSYGEELGDLGVGVQYSQLTKVFEGSSAAIAWTADIELDENGNPYVAFSVRTDDEEEHLRNRYYYGQWTGTEWEQEEIAFAGDSLYEREIFYTGLIALDPSDPERVVISTNVDPETGDYIYSETDEKAHYEIYEGTYGLLGWSWEALTQNSTVDNLRPIIPQGNSTHSALLWFRGEYTTYEVFNSEIVALLNENAPIPQGQCQQEYYQPQEGQYAFSGDFDGDQKTDTFHYLPGVQQDIVYWGNGNITKPNISGTYTPIVGKYWGTETGADQILWSNPRGTSYYWGTNGTDQNFISIVNKQLKGTKWLVGDFNNDGRDDIFYYRAGTDYDVLSLSKPDQDTGRINIKLNVYGSYQPFAANLNGDDYTDIFWYNPGFGKDYVWLYQDSQGKSISKETQVYGSYVPYITRRAEGADDVLWTVYGKGYAHLWDFIDAASDDYSFTTGVR